MSRYEIAADYLAKNKDRWVSPTEIGRLFGGHSSIGSPICKSLVLDQRAERNENGHYRFRSRVK